MKPVYCPNCDIEIKMDANGFPLDRILMVRPVRLSTKTEMAHLECFPNLESAGWGLA